MQRLEILDMETSDIILSSQRTTKVLIRLRGCAGWSAPFFFVVRTWHKQVFSWRGSYMGSTVSGPIHPDAGKIVCYSVHVFPALKKAELLQTNGPLFCSTKYLALQLSYESIYEICSWNTFNVLNGSTKINLQHVCTQNGRHFVEEHKENRIPTDPWWETEILELSGMKRKYFRYLSCAKRKTRSQDSDQPAHPYMQSDQSSPKATLGSQGPKLLHMETQRLSRCAEWSVFPLHFSVGLAVP